MPTLSPTRTIAASHWPSLSIAPPHLTFPHLSTGSRIYDLIINYILHEIFVFFLELLILFCNLVVSTVCLLTDEYVWLLCKPNDFAFSNQFLLLLPPHSFSTPLHLQGLETHSL